MPDKEDIYRMLDAKVHATAIRLPLASQGISSPVADWLKELDPLIWMAAGKVASDPDCLGEVQRNLDYLLSEFEEQAKIHGIMGLSVSNALSRLCPIFPFC